MDTPLLLWKAGEKMNILSLGLCIKFIIVQEKTTPSVIVGNDYHLHPTELGSKEKESSAKVQKVFWTGRRAQRVLLVYGILRLYRVHYNSGKSKDCNRVSVMEFIILFLSFILQI